jgi:carboxymethylenebutenolidase
MILRTLSSIGLIAIVATSLLAARNGRTSPGPAVVTGTPHSYLPATSEAKTVLNAFARHREWAHVPVDGAMVPVFVVYPERADKAPAVLVSAVGSEADDWTRAVGDQIAAEGYIAVVADAVRAIDEGGTLRAVDGTQAADAALRYAAELPAADGTRARVTLDRGAGTLTVSTGGAADRATFALSSSGWQETISHLSHVLGQHHRVSLPERHVHGAPAAQQGRAGGGPAPDAGRAAGARGGGLINKQPHLPAGYFTAESTFANSPRRKEWVDLPLGEGRLRTLVVYPDGNGPAPAVIVMQHGTGLDHWMRGVADQLASQGFIAVAPDLWSGLGPNGGGWDSFEFIDDAIRAAAGKLTPDETMRRYKAARDYALKLPRANGKTASLGFCAGGGNSFRFATEVPDLNAAVVFYGPPPDDAALAKINAPVLGLYGENDARITSTVDATAATMKKLGKRFEPHVYPKATHSFVLFQDVGGNPAAVDAGWTRAIAFLQEHTR